MAQTKKAQDQDNQINLQENEQTQTPPSRQAGANQPQHPQYLEKNEQSRQNRGLTRRGQPSQSGPFAFMRRFSEDMDNLFGDFGFGSLMSPTFMSGIDPLMTMSEFSPQTEVFKRGNDLVVQADLPGMTSDDINVDIEDNQIIIRGERHSENEQDDGDLYHTERSYGSFYRSIPLPEGIDSDQAEAHFNNGVLEITMPMPEQKSKGRSLEIGEGNHRTKQNNKKDSNK